MNTDRAWNPKRSAGSHYFTLLKHGKIGGEFNPENIWKEGEVLYSFCF